MAAFTSAASGNWNASATWGNSGSPPVEGTDYPGDGDTATINHAVSVTANQTVGTDAAATVLAGSGTVSIATSVKLTVKGRIVMTGSMSLAAGSELYCGGTSQYYISIAGGITAVGTSESNAVISSSGDATAAFFANTSNVNAMSCSHVTFDGVGTATSGQWNYLNDDVSWSHVQSVNCGLWVLSTAADESVVFDDVVFTGSKFSTLSIWFTFTAATTGARTIANCVFDKGVWFDGDVTNLDISRCYFGGVQHRLGSASAGGGTNAEMSDCVFYVKPTTAALDINRPSVVSDCYFYQKLTSALHSIDTRRYGAGTYEIDGCIHHTERTEDYSDFIVTYHGGTSTITLDVHNNIVLPSRTGYGSGPLITIPEHAGGYTIQIDHNTVYPGEVFCVEATTSTAIAKTGLVASFRSNLFYCNTGHENYLIRPTTSYRESTTHRGDVDRGTLTDVSATTFTDSAAAWDVNLFSTYTQAYILFLDGDAAGKSTAITGNDSTTVGKVAAWADSTTPGVGDSYVIYMLDIFSPASADYNCKYNTLTTGTIYRQDGTTTTSVNGYNDYWLSTGNPGANDVTLDPGFVDATRNIATADIAHLSNSVGTAWDSGTEYTAGTIVSNSDASFYGGQTINFRAIATNTNKEPGVAADWDSYWEYATAYRLREDTSLIPSLIAWVQAGFAPTNSALQDAGHDGATIGAVEGVFGSVAVLAHHHRQLMGVS